MIEEIKEDNNCIVKAFENNPIAILQEDINNKKVYYFKASDIGKALKLTNIAVSIQHYDEDERVIRKAYDTTNREQDTTFLTSQGVYRLLYNSKKESAKKFRKWAGDILDDIIFNESKELKRQLEEKDKLHKLELEEQEDLTRSTQLALEAEKIKFQLHLNKKFYKSIPCERVYAYKSNMNDPNSAMTLGKTGNIARRESEYNTHNKTGQMTYSKKCYDESLTERVIHHILDKHRIHKDQEWFNINEDLSKEVINISQLILDEFIPYTDLFLKYNVYDKIKNILDEIKINENIVDEIKENIIYSNIYDKKTQNKIIKNNSENERISTLVDNMELTVNNPLDFNKFIKECCNVGDDLECMKVDIYGAHKLWSRNSESSTKKALFKYMDEKYKCKRQFFEEFQSKIRVFIGIKPKEFVFRYNDDNKNLDVINYFPNSQLLSNNMTEYEKFIIDKCKVGFTYRVSYQSIFDEFISWKGYDFKLNVNEKDKIRDYLNKIFFPNPVYLKDSLEINSNGSNIQGIWGLTLKNDNSNIGLNLTSNNKKKVIQIDINTKQIINTWESATSAAKALNIGPSIISTDIRFQRIRQNTILKYVDKENKEIKVKNNKGKKVVKINIETENIVKTWDKLVNALKEIKCTHSTLYKWIESKKNIDGHFYSFG